MVPETNRLHSKKGSSEKGENVTTPRLSLQHPSVLMRAENVLFFVDHNLATNQSGNEVSKYGGAWTARHLRNGDPKPLIAQARDT